jgi:maltose/moltooligosaccharide transporter
METQVDNRSGEAMPGELTLAPEVQVAPVGQEGPVVKAPAEVERFPWAKAVNFSVANLGASFFYGLFNFGMPLYLAGYNLPPWLIGLLANERSFVGAIVQPLVGRISDRTHTRLGKRRPFFLVGVPLVCLGLLALAFHPELWLMISIMAVLAFFLAVAWDPYMAMIGDLFSSEQRGRVGGLIGVGVGLGNILFALVALWLWGSYEFSVFLITIGVLVVTWTYTFFTVKEPPVSAQAEVPAEKVGKPNPVAYVKNLMRYPEAAKYTLAITFFWLGTGGVIPFITLFGVHVLHATNGAEFMLPLAATAVNALIAAPFGILADRIGKKRVMLIGMFSFSVVALLGSQAQDMTQGIIIMMLAGAANAAMAMVNPMLTDLVPPKRMAEFVGLGSSVFSLAQPAGSVIAGLVVGLAALFVGGDAAYRWAFVSAGVMMLIGGVLLRRVYPDRALLDD